MSSEILTKTKKYLIIITVVAVAFAMATTLTFAESGEVGLTNLPAAGAKQGESQEAEMEQEHIRTYEKVIAHGGGSVEGFETSSSVNAVMLAIQNGFKVIELDMVFSSDEKIVMLHDWDRTLITYLGRTYDKPLSLKEFGNQLICGKFEPLTFDKLIKILDKNPDIRIITDTKEDNIKLLTTIAKKYPTYVDRMIPQIYDYDEFEAVSALGYKDIIFTLYAQGTIEYKQLIDFVQTNDIYAVTIPADYWVKGLPQKLSHDGVKVYTHPVSTVEEAKKQMDKGAYGVYSSSLIPAEFEGYGKEYYMMQTDEAGKKVKLTDVTIDGTWIRNVRTHGNMEYKAFKYKLDGKLLEERLAEIGDSPSIKHDLDIELWDIGAEPSEITEPLYTMSYTLTKNKNRVRILDKKYEYRLKPLKPLPRFNKVMSEDPKTNPSEKILDILSESFIAKAGEYYYYNEGESGSYSVADELLTPQKSINGNVMIPLAETITELGADSITMDASRYVYLHMGGHRFVSQAYSGYVRKDTYNIKITEPISLYRSKAMAGGEFVYTATGRNFVQGEDILVILPKDCKVTETEEKELIEAARLLYKETEEEISDEQA